FRTDLALLPLRFFRGEAFGGCSPRLLSRTGLEPQLFESANDPGSNRAYAFVRNTYRRRDSQGHAPLGAPVLDLGPRYPFQHRNEGLTLFTRPLDFISNL